jgi:hypothetical protein
MIQLNDEISEKANTRTHTSGAFVEWLEFMLHIEYLG